MSSESLFFRKLLTVTIVTKVFILAILLLSWQSFLDLSQSSEYQVIEYYAGVARIARLSKGMGYRCAAYDVAYDTPASKKSAKSSPSSKPILQKTQGKGKSAMDLTTSAGFTPLNLHFVCHVSYSCTNTNITN